MFVKQTLDARIEQALPVLARIQQQGNAMKEANIFEAWAERLVEGTWSTPDTPESQQKLLELMSAELPVGADATNATEQLYDLLGDDKLFDLLESLAQQDPNADCRQLVLDRMQELSDLPDVRAVLEQLNIDADATMNPPESLPADLDDQEEQAVSESSGDWDNPPRTDPSATVEDFFHEVVRLGPGPGRDLLYFAAEEGDEPPHIVKAARKLYKNIAIKAGLDPTIGNPDNNEIFDLMYDWVESHYGTQDIEEGFMDYIGLGKSDPDSPFSNAKDIAIGQEKEYPTLINKIAQGGGLGQQRTNGFVQTAERVLQHIYRDKGTELTRQNYAQLVTNRIKADVAKAMGQTGVAEGELEEAMFPGSAVGDKLRDFKRGQGQAGSAKLAMGMMPAAGAGAMAGATMATTAVGATALFAPALGTGALLGAGAALGGFLTYKGLNWLAQKLFGTKEEALEFARAHLKAAGSGQPQFEFQGKTYPVKIKSPQEAQQLLSKIYSLQSQLAEDTAIKSLRRAAGLTEGRMLDEDKSKLDHILDRFKYEVRNFEQGGDLDDDLYDALFDYYMDTGDMPYGTAKARDGDPYEWVAQNLESHLRGGGIIGGVPDEDYGLERESAGDYAPEEIRSAHSVDGGMDNAILYDDSTCNMTEAGEACPVHGVQECWGSMANEGELGTAVGAGLGGTFGGLPGAAIGGTAGHLLTKDETDEGTDSDNIKNSAVGGLAWGAGATAAQAALSALEEKSPLAGQYGHSGKMKEVDKDTSFLDRLKTLSGMK